MLDQALQSQFKALMAHLQSPVELCATFDGGSESSEQLREFLTTISGTSEKIEFRQDGKAQRRPSFSVSRKGSAPTLEFAAVPLGHEFTSFVLAVLWAGGHPPKIDDETLAQVRALSRPLHFEVYMSLSCHNCPDVVQALSLAALFNPGVKVTVIDGGLFPQEVADREVMAVPSVYLNGRMFGMGRMDLSEILSKLDEGRASRTAELLSKEPIFDVLVIGGGPAGAAAAVYAARKGIRTGLVTDRMGGQVNDTLSIENYISVQETTGPRFAADLEHQVRHYDVRVMASHRAAELIPSQDGMPVRVRIEGGGELSARTIVLAPGARWRNVNVPGEQEFKNKGVAYCPHCDGPLFKGKRIAVIGGGNSGVEAAIDLAGIVEHVTLVEFADKLKADAVLVRKLQSLPNVTVRVSTQTTEIRGLSGRVSELGLRHRVTGQEEDIPVEGVFVQIGLVPNTEWLKDVLTLSPGGEIVVDARGQTSLEGVFAAGDATTAPYKQIVVAAGDGAKAALGAFDQLIRLS